MVVSPGPSLNVLRDRPPEQDSAKGIVPQPSVPLPDGDRSDGWAMTPSGMRGVLNDAISLYFADATLASAFVARWCVGSKAETAGGVFRVREDEPAPRVGAGLHRTP